VELSILVIPDNFTTRANVVKPAVAVEHRVFVANSLTCQQHPLAIRAFGFAFVGGWGLNVADHENAIRTMRRAVAKSRLISERLKVFHPTILLKCLFMVSPSTCY
jgi:hypothetical protein